VGFFARFLGCVVISVGLLGIDSPGEYAWYRFWMPRRALLFSCELLVGRFGLVLAVDNDWYCLERILMMVIVGHSFGHLRVRHDP